MQGHSAIANTNVERIPVMKYESFKRHMNEIGARKVRGEAGDNRATVEYWRANESVLVCTRYENNNVDWFYLSEPDDFGDYSPYYEELELRYG